MKVATNVATGRLFKPKPSSIPPKQSQTLVFREQDADVDADKALLETNVDVGDSEDTFAFALPIHGEDEAAEQGTPMLEVALRRRL
eukprot:jgi/Psemu1/25813/gm1.25813_g